MSLREDIEKFIEQATKRIPQETFNMIVADNRRLEQSGIADNSLKVGDKAPSFSLPNVEGERISSVDLLAKGPLVLSFYRGGW